MNMKNPLEPIDSAARFMDRMLPAERVRAVLLTSVVLATYPGWFSITAAAQSAHQAGGVTRFGPPVLKPCGEPLYPNPCFPTPEINPGVSTSADVDGDGDTDFVTVRWPDNALYVLLKESSGTFTPQAHASLGFFPEAITSADLDDDGDMDLVAANYETDRVDVILNHGNGTFAVPVAYGVGDSPFDVTSADLDADGDTDLVATSLSSALSVLVNQGDGTFAAYVPHGIGLGGYSVTSADFDGDGDVDLATAGLGGFAIRLSEPRQGYVLGGCVLRCRAPSNPADECRRRPG
jgi:hypothetical protein